MAVISQGELSLGVICKTHLYWKSLIGFSPALNGHLIIQTLWFEEFWTEFEGFIETIENHWQNSTFTDSAKNIVAKFKSIRKGLKVWSKKISQLSKTIEYCCFYVKLLDGVEDQRYLTRIESNFRKALIKHTNKLLEAKRKYWRIGGNIRWANLGDENTKKFHATATQVFRHNYISFIKSSDNIEVHEHEQKAAILWQSFKDRIGKIEDTVQLFDIQNMALQVIDDSKTNPFTTEEIDNVIKCMPNDKSPGPDGFNGLFMKKCWHIIKECFYTLIKDFQDEKVNLEPINSAFISLIPKNDNPETPNDFRPISLVSMPATIINKLLANRAQQIILSVISKNQYGFIKGRSIQDCLAWSFEYIHMFHKSKNQAIIFKIDFEKAFDKVDHNAIYFMMKHLGFCDKWIRWTKMLLSNATSSIILNGVPSKVIKCRRVVRQSDPYSPLLYVMVAELLQILVNKAWQQGEINLPVEYLGAKRYPIIQYADDTLIIMPADPTQLIKMREILEIFSSFTGLKDIPWVEMIWDTYYSDGTVPTYPTRDVWQQDTLVNTFPQLHSFAKEENITIANAIDATENDFYSMFHLPMSSIAVQQSQKELLHEDGFPPLNARLNHLENQVVPGDPNSPRGKDNYLHEERANQVPTLCSKRASPEKVLKSLFLWTIVDSTIIVAQLKRFPSQKISSIEPVMK
ncbi:uncharacterized protein [Aegilops tauschii subsp. strangulata]|uniref:uncharacterized protein n=1 Tax=Aegilops tauschii subsp. strangulata TaxID=200361 RepID=UPI003CC8C51F